MTLSPKINLGDYLQFYLIVPNKIILNNFHLILDHTHRRDYSEKKIFKTKVWRKIILFSLPTTKPTK